VLYISELTYINFVYVNYIYIYIYTTVIQHLFPLTQEQFLNSFKYFNVVINLTKLKTITTVCIYIQGVRTDLFCQLPRPSP